MALFKVLAKAREKAEPINPHFISETTAGPYYEDSIVPITMYLVDESNNPATNIKKLRILGDGYYYNTIVKEDQWKEGEASNMLYMHGNYNLVTLEYFILNGEGQAVWNFVELDVYNVAEGQELIVVIDTDTTSGVVTDIKAINPMHSLTSETVLREIIIQDESGEEVTAVSSIVAKTTEDDWSAQTTYIESYEWSSGKAKQWAYVNPSQELEFRIDKFNDYSIYTSKISPSKLENNPVIVTI